MSIISVIYNNPTSFDKYLPAYSPAQQRRGIIFATIMGFDVSSSMSIVDMRTALIIAAIRSAADTQEIDDWVPLYTFGYSTEHSLRVLSARRIKTADRELVIPSRASSDAMAACAACAAGSPGSYVGPAIGRDGRDGRDGRGDNYGLMYNTYQPHKTIPNITRVSFSDIIIIAKKD